MSAPASGPPGPAGPAGPRGAAGPTILIPKQPGVDAGEKRENARRNIAYGAIGAFLLFLFIPLLFWAVGLIKLDDAVKMITTIAGVLAGIVGAIVGFYFRQEEQQ